MSRKPKGRSTIKAPSPYDEYVADEDENNVKRQHGPDTSDITITNKQKDINNLQFVKSGIEWESNYITTTSKSASPLYYNKKYKKLDYVNKNEIVATDKGTERLRFIEEYKKQKKNSLQKYEEINKLKKDFEEKLKILKEEKQKAEAELEEKIRIEREIEATQVVITPKNEKKGIFSSEVYTKEVRPTYEERKKKLKDWAEYLAQNKPDLHKRRIALTGDINVNIAQISADLKSVDHKVGTLSLIIKGVADFAQKNNEPNFLLYTYTTISEKFMLQCIAQIIPSNISSAYPLAMVATSLCAQFPDFKTILFNHIYKECCYLLPTYLLKPKDVSSAQYKKYLGYKNEEETDDTFFDRISGFVAFWAAITQTDFPENQEHPYGIENSWKWMAKILNSGTRKITPLLLLTVLQVAGWKMQQVYKHQFVKLIMFLKEEYCKLMNDYKPMNKPSLSRLESWLQNWEANGRNIDCPPGRNLTYVPEVADSNSDDSDDSDY